MKSKNKDDHTAGRARPVADRARDASEELEPGSPRVSALADEDDFDAVFAAGVAAAGESDRPAGSQVPPEYPTDDITAETDVDSVFALDPDDTADAELDDKLEGRDTRPDEPEPFDETDLTPDEPTAVPRTHR